MQLGKNDEENIRSNAVALFTLNFNVNFGTALVEQYLKILI